MARVGQTIENPVSGEEITWIETAHTTAGELLSFDLSLRRGAAVAAEHRHLRQEERFRVLAGTVEVEVAGNRWDVGLGEEVVVPAGVPHRWCNRSQEEATVRVELRPALDTETFFENFFGLARDGKTNGKGIPSLLQIAVALQEMGDSCPSLTRPPAVVQRAAFVTLAPIGRVLGRRAVYAQYSPGHESLSRYPDQ